ncbi:peroxiredoxin family protein [Chitinophaga eiseniae]|uniref:TlpA family protein disulfide reductase n=1 Tax=Chitinophaga eiseniae TaxID=634771 RepID=A0A847SUC7_9BACT|nr:TlpA disulfide reductase family protein [Chitinophaga eiseniae]NLR80132.1 TlpA family protein disulfide reductase [Chitinophaga eiseniae]
MNKVEEDFIRSHPDSWVSLDLVESHSVNLKPEIIEPLLMGLSRKLRNSAIGKYLATRLASEKKTGIGQPAIPFTQNDTEGKPVSLASFKGKYVLVDFWASWCSPCRAENPNLLKAYNQFKDKNFEIIGVSLDHNKAFWLKAVKEDGMPWIQLSDLQGPNNAAARAYGITGIPQNFLLDPNGLIIAKDLRGEEVIKKLTEVLSK